MSNAMTLAIERIADDRRFAERFRDDPHRALRRYRLDDEQIDAIKQGDVASLRPHDVDLVAFEEGVRHGWRPYARKCAALFVGIGISFGLLTSTATAAPRCDLKRCFQLTGLRRARASQGRHTIRIGRVLVRRSSIRAALARAGQRGQSGRHAKGRRSLRAALDDFCEEYCEVSGEEIEPFVYVAG